MKPLAFSGAGQFFSLLIRALLLLFVAGTCLSASACRKKRAGSGQQVDVGGSTQEKTVTGAASPGTASRTDPHFTTKPIPTNAPPPISIDPKTGQISVVNDTKVLRSKVSVEGKQAPP